MNNKITLISLSTPTFNNVRAASALPYHLICGAKKIGVRDFEVYSFNINNIADEEIKGVEQDLGIKIFLFKCPYWIKWLITMRLSFLRVLLRYPLYCYCKIPSTIVQKINYSNSDVIWIYGEELMNLVKYFPTKENIVTMPDCESLYYYRMLRQPWNSIKLQHVIKYSFAYWQYRNMERTFYKDNTMYHFVGKADADFFKSVNIHSKTLFLRHPLYAYNTNKAISFHQPMIKLLFTGRYDFYCQHRSDEFLSALEKSNLAPYYELTFLGKGWENWNDKLINVGYKSHHIAYVPNYIKEIQKHDIQVNAIDVGTGTKGKVLDGIANGLLIIGTPYALENISVCHDKSCIMLSNGIQFVQTLKEIKNNVSFYEGVAKNGRAEVLKNHDTVSIVKSLFQGIN